MSKIKGVIMAAGYGTRFFPITKSIPKEMLPIVNKPSIDFIIDEFQQAGIHDIIIITHRKKKSLEDYLDFDPELDHFLTQENKTSLLKEISPRSDLNFAFVKQQHMKGTGDALLLVENLVGDSPFILAYPDDVLIAKESVSLQMKNVYLKNPHTKAILACEELQGDVSRFGVVNPTKKLSSNLYEMSGMIEKPKQGQEPSKIISIGRYLLTPEIFSVLRSLKPQDQKGEFFLTDALQELASQNACLSYLYEGQRLDLGEPHSYVKSLLFYIKNHPEYSKYLEETQCL